MLTRNSKELGEILRERRRSLVLTVAQLAAKSGVSPSHLARIEVGERSPSGWVLRRIAKPLGFSQYKLFTLAGYLRPQAGSAAKRSLEYGGRRLDPYVATMLSQEPFETQRSVVTILGILKGLAGTSHRKSP